MGLQEKESGRWEGWNVQGKVGCKGFTQEEGIDHRKTSPVAMFKSIWILLAIVAHLDDEIWQMDVKIAFLNGQPDVDFYLM